MLWNNISEQLVYCCQTGLPMKVVKPRLATLFMLRTVEGDFGCHLGLKCSSFCKMNVGTSARSACAAIGWEPYESVSLGNMLLERTAFCFAAVQFKFTIFAGWACKLVTPYHDRNMWMIYTRPSRFRSCLLIYLATCLGGVWSLEQPAGALTEYYPAFRETVQNIFECGGPTAARAPFWQTKALQDSAIALTISNDRFILWFHLRCPIPCRKVQCVRWWMGHYKAPTPKRHYAYSNSPAIKRIDKGVLQGWKQKGKAKNKPVEHYVDSKGRKRYKGTPSLRSTENLWFPIVVTVLLWKIHQ